MTQVVWKSSFLLLHIISCPRSPCSSLFYIFYGAAVVRLVGEEEGRELERTHRRAFCPFIITSNMDWWWLEGRRVVVLMMILSLCLVSINVSCKKAKFAQMFSSNGIIFTLFSTLRSTGSLWRVLSSILSRRVRALFLSAFCQKNDLSFLYGRAWRNDVRENEEKIPFSWHLSMVKRKKWAIVCDIMRVEQEKITYCQWNGNVVVPKRYLLGIYSKMEGMVYFFSCLYANLLKLYEVYGQWQWLQDMAQFSLSWF